MTRKAPRKLIQICEFVAKGMSYTLELEAPVIGLDIIQIVHQGGARDGVTAIEAEACSDTIWSEIVAQAQ